jgi:hypothetical protein
MTQIIQESNAACIVKGFQNIDVSILKEASGDKTKCYFRATDVGKALGLVNVHTSIQCYEDDEKVLRKAYDQKGNLQETTFLTSHGVYRLLYSSKKDVAKKFRKWAGDILDDILFNPRRELKQQLDSYQQRSHSVLTELGSNKQVVYVGDIGNNMVKFGRTDNLNRRVTREHENDFPTFTLLYVIECKNNIELETRLKNEQPIKQRRKSLMVNGHKQIEIIQLDESYGIENLIETLQKLKELIERKGESLLAKEIAELELKQQEAKAKQLETELELERLRTLTEKERIEELKCKQLQMTLELETSRSRPIPEPADPEVKPLSILPNTHITSMQQFYQTWVTQYKQQYLEHKQKHGAYLWTNVFGKQAAHQAKQRYHKSSPFLSFIDSQVDPEATLVWLNALATERKIEPNRFVKVILPMALNSELRCPCMRSRGPCSCKEDSAFLRAKLIETGRLPI